ncbi:MAG: hypothetical protein DMF48_01935 [Verrucomicrobia bacterium]|nr:MAG: hypothetical protein DMF48_01935 [Verrucomicrobiota bacterium]
MISTRTKWILGGISTVLGALGSGLWSGVFAPLGSIAFRGLLSIVTLGLAAAKDSVYRRAALGFAERASELLLAALAGGVIAIPICMLLFAMIFPRLRKRLKTGSFDRHSNWVQSVLFCTQLFVTSILLVQNSVSRVHQLRRRTFPPKPRNHRAACFGRSAYAVQSQIRQSKVPKGFHSAL